jgi:acetyltransferase
VLATQGVPRGPRTAIVTMSGGAAALCADRAASIGLPLARLSGPLRAGLGALMPDTARVGNPIDVTAHAMTRPDLLLETVRTLADDPGVDIVLVQLTTNADPAAQAMAHGLAGLAAADRPDRARLIVSRLGSPSLAPGAMAEFRRGGLPVLSWPEDAVATAWMIGAAAVAVPERDRGTPRTTSTRRGSEWTSR